MKSRPYWVQRIEEAWTKRPIVWLSGVRRVGKTTLAQMLPSAAYLNCDLPSASRDRSVILTDYHEWRLDHSDGAAR